ncbi:hypothetical protein Tco_1211425 [Tanacetum coccineum]
MATIRYLFAVKALKAMLVYVDDLLIIGNDEAQICRLETQLTFSYLSVSTQESYLNKGEFSTKPYELLMDPNLKHYNDIGTPFTDLGIYRRFIVVSRSLAQVEYRVMALTCFELTRLVSLLKEFGIKDLEPLDLYCDNQAALCIAANLVFHVRTKHIEVDCHYVRDQMKVGNPSYVHTKSQLANVFTKVVIVDQHNKLLFKLEVCDSPDSQFEGNVKAQGTCL